MQQRDRLVNEKERFEEGLSLRERIIEVLKKYGITVTATVLGVGTVISAVIRAITNAQKTLGKGMGIGLKEIDKKTASNFPGLISSIVTLIFKTAGQAISFLPEHTWLLIVAAVAFLMEQFINNNNRLFNCPKFKSLLPTISGAILGGQQYNNCLL